MLSRAKLINRIPGYSRISQLTPLFAERTFSARACKSAPIEVPKGGWDTHVHVFDPQKWPYALKRRYTPASASLQEYPDHITGSTSLVIVHASMQGASPAPLVDALSRELSLPGFTLRGLATLDLDSLTNDDLDKLHTAGIRGTRMHLMTAAAPKSSEIVAKMVESAASRIARLGWVIDLFCPLEVWAGMTDTILNLDPRVHVVADHFGSAFPGDERKPEFEALLHLIEERLYVKLAAAERIYHGNPCGIDSLGPIAKAIIEAGPERIMYGSDWPHTQMGEYRKGRTQEQKLTETEPFRDVPNAMHVEKLRAWISDEGTWRKFWIDNPKKVFS